MISKVRLKDTKLPRGHSSIVFILFATPKEVSNQLNSGEGKGNTKEREEKCGGAEKRLKCFVLKGLMLGAIKYEIQKAKQIWG